MSEHLYETGKIERTMFCFNEDSPETFPKNPNQFKTPKKVTATKIDG